MASHASTARYIGVKWTRPPMISADGDIIPSTRRTESVSNSPCSERGKTNIDLDSKNETPQVLAFADIHLLPSLKRPPVEIPGVVGEGEIKDLSSVLGPGWFVSIRPRSLSEISDYYYFSPEGERFRSYKQARAEYERREKRMRRANANTQPVKNVAPKPVKAKPAPIPTKPKEPPRPASPSPAPSSAQSPSSASLSSTFSSVVLKHMESKNNTAATANVAERKNAKGNAAATVATKNPRSGSTHRHAAVVAKATKKVDRKWMCRKCQGDVRLPPPSSAVNGESLSNIDKDEEVVKEFLGRSTVMCARKGCLSPRFHLTCSGLPMGSQIYRTSILTCQETANRDAAASKQYSANNGKKYDATMILKHLYSTSSSLSSTGGWWDQSPTINPLVDTQRSQLSLQNDINWPTSMESFMCPDCNVEGTSRYLLEYFERFRDMKIDFYEKYLSEDYEDNTGKRLDRADECVEARTGEAFLCHLMKNNQKDHSRRQGGDENGNNGVIDWNPSEIQLNTMSKILTIMSKELQQQQKQQQRRRQKRQKTKFQLDPSYLVGMPIRFYNPIEQTYHTGRIVDYKFNAPYKVDDECNKSTSFPATSVLTDKKIGSTLYLIRFRHGIEGRKIAVHQWIYLEEHAVSVGGEVCWAKVGDNNATKDDGVQASNSSKQGNLKDTGCDANETKPDAAMLVDDEQEEYMSHYRPVQIIFRSMLEMIPVRNLNDVEPESTENTKPCNGGKNNNESSSLNILAMGFGRSFSHVRLSLNDSGKNNTIKDGEGDDEPSSRPDAIPLTSSNPPWIDRMLHRAQLSDDDVAMGLAMACMEKEEERRVRAWRHLSVSHISATMFAKRKCQQPIRAKKVLPAAAAAAPSTNKAKKRSIQYTSPATSQPPSKKIDLGSNNISVGTCRKCQIERKTGTKTSRVHDESCPRKKNFKYTVSLEAAAATGCKKCIREVATGQKSDSYSHCHTCPRKRKFQ